ncbi:protein translocase subunit SecD [Longivirga aurantiaca]|uniref:Protein translocase subunit SecD n=1 Tax=Longivirga aurantiaca TaxID=1837743 RepID=A0ABW1T2N6_9ACTN
MAAPTQASARPGRTLVILGLVILGLVVWTLWPGQSHTPKLGLDLRGGTQVILTPTSADGGGAITDDQLKQTVEIIRQRVDGFGVAESEVTTQGSGSNATIVVSIPGVTNQAVLDSLATTAKLDFRPVLAIDFGSPQVAPSGSPSPSPSSSASGSSSASPSASASASPSASPSASANGAPLPQTAASGSATPTASASPSPSASGTAAAGDLPPIQSATNDAAFQAKYVALDCLAPGATQGGPADPKKFIATCQDDGSLKYLLDPAAVEGTEIASAQATIAQQGVGWEVQLTFTPDGATQFAEVTGQLAQNPSPQNQFAITLDGLVQSAPYVSQAILGGNAVITGSFTAEEAKALANVLKYGSLPVALKVSSVEQLSPTLGQDQLDAGLIAGALGLLLVVVYLCLYYRALGLVAVASLLVAAVITYTLIVILGRQIGFTLSLAGVAGVIVAIGITADSFVVYFERIRDEIREGRTHRQAGDLGWIRARRTILAADFVSLLAAVVLYFLSVGSVRGFAFTLGLTTLVDVAVAFLFTRPLVQILMRNKAFTSGKPWTGLSPDRLGVKQTISDDAPRQTLAASRAASKES